jgi:hypothetical protein
MTNNNKPKAKKPEPKSAASMYSQNIDYFWINDYELVLYFKFKWIKILKSYQ